MTDDKEPAPIEIDVEELSRVEDESEPAAVKNRKSPLEDPGAPGGTAGTGGSANEQDD